MQLSPMGLTVTLVLLAATLLARRGILVALMGSLAFGSTAIAAIPSLGGSSPLIYTVFCAILLSSVVLHRTLARDIGGAVKLYPTSWLVLLLMIFAVLSSIFFPRLFADQTSAFVPTSRGVVEVALGPVSGNISQTGYFVLGGLTYFAVLLLMMRRLPIREVRRAFFLWIFLHTIMGMIDFWAKVMGMGDVLAPIRTANYAMLTEASHAGFWRIVGPYSEASAFAGASLAGLGFTYVYWRRTGSHLAFALSVTLLLLTLLSTSSTAYAGLAILSIPVAWSIAGSISRQRLSRADIFLLAAFAMCLLAAMSMMLANPRFFDPFLSMLDSLVLNKMTSDSGQERSYWNYRSLQSLMDTGGLGVGFGSSRASSWPIAVISQLGVLGALLMALLVVALGWESRGFRQHADPETRAIIAAIRAAAFGGLISSAMISGSADPGIVFFVTLAVITCVQARYAYRGANMIERPMQVHLSRR